LNCSDQNAAISLVADRLSGHANPVVEALHRWSGFSDKALWAMVSSSWVGPLLNISNTMHLYFHVRASCCLYLRQESPLLRQLSRNQEGRAHRAESPVD
jgi:hypothetical protein